MKNNESKKDNNVIFVCFQSKKRVNSQDEIRPLENENESFDNKIKALFKKVSN